MQQRLMVALVHQSEMEQCLIVAAGLLMNYSLMGYLADVSQSKYWKCTYYIYAAIVLQFMEYYFNKIYCFSYQNVEPQMTAKDISTVLGLLANILLKWHQII